MRDRIAREKKGKKKQQPKGISNTRTPSTDAMQDESAGDGADDDISYRTSSL
jgi:hypothetical protein